MRIFGLGSFIVTENAKHSVLAETDSGSQIIMQVDMQGLGYL